MTGLGSLPHMCVRTGAAHEAAGFLVFENSALEPRVPLGPSQNEPNQKCLPLSAPTAVEQQNTYNPWHAVLLWMQGPCYMCA